MRRNAALLVCAVFLCAACSDGPPKKEKPLSVPGEKLYTVEGTILGRDADDNNLRVDHKEIPGFMEAMTMDYPVRGADVKTLPADKSRFSARLHVTDSGYWLTDVKQVP